MELAIQLAYLIILLALSAFFSSSETALLSLPNWKIEHLRSNPSSRKAGERIHQLRRRATRLLSAILVGNNVVNIAAATLTETLFHKHLSLYLPSSSTFLAAGLMTIVILLFGEVTPKTLALARAEKLASWESIPIRWLIILLWPLVIVFEGVFALIERVFHLQQQDKRLLVTEGEFKALVRQSEQTGVLAKHEGRIIRKILNLKNTPVKALMLPRTQMKGLSEEEPVESAFRLIKDKGPMRIPVFRGSLDHITGILYAKDLAPVRLGQSKPARIGELIRPPLFVPDSKTAKSLLQEMMTRRIHIAIILDEQGGTAGMVTIEDLLNELTGKAAEAKAGGMIRPVSAQEIKVSGLLSIEWFNAYFSANFQHGELRTIGGLVMNAFGYLPDEGEQIEIEGFRFTVSKLAGTRIFEVAVQPPAASAEPEKRA